MTKPKKAKTTQQQVRALRQQVTNLQGAFAMAVEEKGNYMRDLLQARQDLARAKDAYEKLTIQLARRDGYIERLRETEAYAKEMAAKEQDARLGIKSGPTLAMDYIDQLREHLTACPEDEAKKILDVISNDLKNRVTGFDPANPEHQDGLHFRHSPGSGWRAV